MLTTQGRATLDVFLQVTPVSGPVIVGGTADALYAGWIEALSFEAGSEIPVTIGPGPDGVTVGRAGFKEFTLVKKVDAASTALFSKVASGGALTTVKMVVVLHSPNRVELWDIKATTCRAIKQSYSGESGADPVERITFAMGAIEWSYIRLNASGDALSEYFANWSIITNSGTHGTRTPDYLGGVDSDGWETFYGLNKNAADSGVDTDDDGLDNLHEYIAHTDPRVPQSGAPGNYLLTWQSVAGLNYRILTAPAAGGPFTFLKNVASAGDGTTSPTVAGPAGQFFYRVVTP